MCKQLPGHLGMYGERRPTQIVPVLVYNSSPSTHLNFSDLPTKFLAFQLDCHSLSVGLHLRVIQLWTFLLGFLPYL